MKDFNQKDYLEKSRRFISSFLFISLFSIFSLNTYSQELDISNLDDLPDELIEEIGENLIINNELPKDLESLGCENDIDCKQPENLEKFNQSIYGSKFGYSYFSSIPTSVMATGDLPLPNDYVISLRDVFTILLHGSKSRIFDLTVQLDGTISFPEIGPISVVGLTLQEAKEKISSLVEISFVGTKVDLSIKSLSGKKITIVGAVNVPGTYLVNPFSTITSSLAYSGGVSPIGTLREIKLIKSDGSTYNFDLYELLIFGDRSNDLTIDAGDTILVGPANKFVSLQGSVKRPGTYEIKKGELLSDLIDFGLGFTDKANLSKISLEVLDSEKSEIKQFVASDQNINLDGILSVQVFNLKQNQKRGILVQGAVKKPGYYDYEKYNSISDLLEDIEFTGDIYPFAAILQSKKPSLFNLNDIDSYSKLELKMNDSVYFYSKNDLSIPSSLNNLSRNLIDEYSLYISGIRGVGNIKIPMAGKFSLEEIIDFFGYDLTHHNLDKTLYVSPLEDISLTGSYKNFNFEARKYHRFTFREISSELISINVYGEVFLPGKYFILKGSTLDDAWRQIGKFRSNADLKSIVLLRESIRAQQVYSLEQAKRDLSESLLLSKRENPQQDDYMSYINSLQVDTSRLGRLSGNLKPGSDESKSIILENGDQIFIKPKNYTVTVLGQVYQPLTMTFQKNRSLTDYIEMSGGYRDYANKRKVYIISSDGTVRSKRGWLGFRVRPGDTIIVPMRLPKNYVNVPLITSLSSIISNLAFAAASLNILENNN